jgi:cytochrome c oxidase subunit 2
VHGNTRLEIGWTVLPALLLAIIAVPTVATIFDLAENPGPKALQVNVEGKQWWWQFSYPDAKVVTADELIIPAGRAVNLKLTACAETIGGCNVIHSFWVPELGPKMDMLPGSTNHLRLFARRTGSFEGQCAEFCGVEHAWMRIRVIVESQSDFETWLAAQRLPAAVKGSEGERVLLSNICVNCHTIRGTAAAGTAGPDLTHVGARATIGAGVLPNDVARMRAWLADPQRYKPGSLMPRVPLSDADLDALAAYLVSLR